MNIWLTLKTVEKFKEEIQKRAIDNIGEDDNSSEGLFDSSAITATIEEQYFKDGIISFNWLIKYKGEDLMNFFDEIEIDLQMGADIVTHFMKKVGQLKTVLEAVKK